MPTHSQTEAVAKKRKHASADVLGEPSTKRSKTEKTSKKEHKDRKEKKDKGKAKEEDGQFKVFQATLALSIAPIFASNLQAGAEEMLDSMIMRYIPALQGVVLSHSNLQFLDSASTIKADCPFCNVRVGFEATVWCPHVGMKLSGKVNLCSPDHVSLLVHRTFNVSIPRRHITTDNWEFEYGPAENDPEFGATAAEGEQTAEGEEGEGAVITIEGSGKWVHKVTGTTLGGLSGELEFTVIGLIIANQMLSLVGSIQPDPFPIEEEYQQLTAATTASEVRTSISPEDESDVEDADDSDDNDEEMSDALTEVARKPVTEVVERRVKNTEGAAAEKKRKQRDLDKDKSKGKKSKS
ncbi:hypothetical protein EUX98_g892 [Antrodiella citrinella]|uniref:RPA43 OB domain-containing protein n=1 Tax=Antrodiella citrinella TaxID=2447956 RepID=A0A4S4NBC7_9APHY|nr:hypothetical protein EUX98_g892 [Antrodiella citrinella]